MSKFVHLLLVGIHFNYDNFGYFVSMVADYNVPLFIVVLTTGMQALYCIRCTDEDKVISTIRCLETVCQHNPPTI